MSRNLLCRGGPLDGEFRTINDDAKGYSASVYDVETEKVTQILYRVDEAIGILVLADDVSPPETPPRRYDPPGRVTRCPSCGAPIVWAVTAKGAKMPVDVKTSDFGSVFLAGGKAHVLTAERREAAVLRGFKLHMPHHATCPKPKRKLPPSRRREEK